MLNLFSVKYRDTDKLSYQTVLLECLEGSAVQGKEELKM